MFPTPQAEGILKYSHVDSIQCISFNPATHHLASCTCSEIGLWSPQNKSVSKEKITTRALSLSWTSDGQLLAIGLENGGVSIRDRSLEQKYQLKIGGAVWAVKF